MVDLTGQVLGERYRVDAFLGRGGMADVYKVRDLQRAVFLAMKVLHADLARDQVFWKRFEREAQTLEMLQHPNIVRFYGLEKAHKLSFILLDYIDGLTLSKELFLYKNPLPPARVLEIAEPVCAALYFAHNMGLVHCDIKPGNIMIHRNGTVFLTDFGIARMNKSTTQPLMGLGTPAYMAPEQFAAKEPTPATDIYALGVVLFEMLTGGKRPFSGEEARASGTPTEKIVWEKLNLPIPSPAKYNPKVTPEMQAVVMHCLEPDPQRRFASALDLLETLEAAAGNRFIDDEAQTRVDLPPKISPPARAARSRMTTEEKPQPAAGKPMPAPDKSLPQAGKPLPASGKSVSVPGKPLPAEEKPPPEIIKPRSTNAKSSAVAPAAESKPPPAADNPPAETGKTRPAGKKPAAGAALPEQEKARSEAGKRHPLRAALEAEPAKPEPAAAIPGPAAGKPRTEAGKPSSEVEKPSPENTHPAVKKPGTRAGKTSEMKAPAGQQVSRPGEKSAALPVRRQALTRWLMAGAAVLALVLIGLALLPGTPAATAPTFTPTALAASGAVTATSPAVLPAPTFTPGSNPEPQATVQVPAPLPTATAAASPTPLGASTALGGGGRVAFASDRGGSLQVWVMDPGNPDDRLQITEARDGACQPAWSPDGTQIAFTTPCKGPSVYYPSATIKIIRLADKKVTDLPVKSPGVAGAFDPAWSPDGETLVFTAILGENTEIRSINLKDQQVRTLTSRGTKNAQPAWSRDGKLITFIFSDNRNTEALWSMQPDGDSLEVLSHAGRFSEPAWSPDGTHILVSLNKGDNIPILALVDRSNPTQGAALLLPDAAYRMSHGSFSPDGRWIVFWTDKTKTNNSPEIILASIDGKEVRQLTSNTLRDFQPAWSPK